MIRTRGRKILRDVWARKGRTFLVSTAIFIGVAGTIALFSMSDILVSQLREDIKEEKLAMGQIAVAVDPDTQLDDARYLQMLDDFPGVTEVMGGMESMPVYFKLEEDAEDFEDGYANSSAIWNGDEENPGLLVVPFEGEMPIEPMRLVDGAYPTAGADEIAIEQRMADKYGIELNDTLYLRVLSPSRDPEQNGAVGTVEPWTVTAVVFDPYALYPEESIYTDLVNGNYLGGRNGFNDIWVRFTDYPTAEAGFDGFTGVIAQETPYTPAFVETEDPANNSLIQQAQTIGSLMGFLALVALIVSGFLVINVISSLVVEQKRQIGVMKSMGATRQDNFYIYSGIAFVYGLIGVIPGVIVGIPGGNAAANALAPQLNTLLEGFNISPFSIILGIVIGLLVPVLASVIPVFNGTRVQILDAMTDLGIDANYGSGPIARLIGILPIPITIRQGLSNVSLKKSRLAFTVVTLAIAVGAFMGIYAIFSSLTDGIQVYIDTFNVDIGLAPSDARDPDLIEGILLDNFQTEDNNLIKGVEPGFMSQVEFEGYDPPPTTGGPPGIFAYGYDIESDDPAFRFEIDEGKPLTPETADDGIILSSLLAANMDKKLGDTVVLKVPGNSAEFTIVGISEFPLDQVWMSWQTLANIKGYTLDRITSDSPIPGDMIPPEARSFIKYVSLVEVEGYESEGPMPGTLVLGLTPAMGSYLTFVDGDFFSTTAASVSTLPNIIVSRNIAEAAGFTVGQMISLQSTTGDQNSAVYRIAGIFEPPSLMTEGGISTDFIGMYWRDLTDLDGATVESAPQPQIYFMTTTLDDPTADDLDKIINDMNEVMVNEGIPIFSLNFVELTDEISAAFFTIQAILSAVAGLIALVGALGLLTTLSMSVFERQKEIGVMRSIGASSGTVVTQFLTEGLVVGVIAWLVGLPLMILIQFLLLQITGFSETFPLEFSPEATVIGLIGMLIITIIASLWPSLGAARKTVSDILRYQ